MYVRGGIPVAWRHPALAILGLLDRFPFTLCLKPIATFKSRPPPARANTQVRKAFDLAECKRYDFPGWVPL
jgi:hypothetical protein